MPHYRIIKEIPDVLNFSNGRVYFQDYYAGGEEWVWYCKRETVTHASVKLCLAKDAVKLEESRKTGISVEKDSVADAVLASLVRRGYAERLPESSLPENR